MNPKISPDPGIPDQPTTIQSTGLIIEPLSPEEPVLAEVEVTAQPHRLAGGDGVGDGDGVQDEPVTPWGGEVMGR